MNAEGVHLPQCAVIDVKKCQQCNCWKPVEDYIGSRGLEVKKCKRCRERQARQKQKPEIREKRSAAQAEKKYYQETRQRRREEDEEGYLAHQAALARAYRQKAAAKQGQQQARPPVPGS